jgi:hypothetical protein
MTGPREGVLPEPQRHLHELTRDDWDQVSEVLMGISERPDIAAGFQEIAFGLLDTPPTTPDAGPDLVTWVVHQSGLGG